jgi:tetratricopeptide (TPR) repeat protein
MRQERLISSLFIVSMAILLTARGRAIAVGTAPGEGEPVAIGTYRSLYSDVLGEDRPLLVSLPKGYESSMMSYPVFFVLYGDQVRGYFAEAVHVVDRLSEEGSIPRLIVVGVANIDRYRDLSPIDRRGNPSGIEAFSQFVSSELIPYIDNEYRTKDYRILMGPQAGAEFGLYSLVHHANLFDALIIGNPFRSLSVRNLLHEAFMNLARAGFANPKFVQITCPDAEGGIDKATEVAYVRDFEEELTDAPVKNLRWVVRYIEENKEFIPSLLLKEGLRELFHDYAFSQGQEFRGLDDVVQYYSVLSKRLGFEVDIPERVLASGADALSVKGNIDATIEILEYMVSVYPTSVDGYWRLANLCRELGDNQAALKYYRKCIEIIPNMRPAREWIDRLENDL